MASVPSSGGEDIKLTNWKFGNFRTDFQNTTTRSQKCENPADMEACGLDARAPRNVNLRDTSRISSPKHVALLFRCSFPRQSRDFRPALYEAVV